MTSKRDWRSAADYADTVSLSLSGWAWEFLRRNPDYQAEVQVAAPSSEGQAAAGKGWGLSCCRRPRAGGP